MDYKTYFKPNKEKIINTIILLALTAIFIRIPLISYLIFPIKFMAILGYTNQIATSFILLIAAYIASCKQDKRRSIIIRYFIILFIIMAAMMGAVILYNTTTAKYCETDSDCKFICESGSSFNDKHIQIKIPGMYVSCVGGIFSVCENKKCNTIDINEAKEPQDCEKYTGDMREHCYVLIATEKKDFELCKKINYDSLMYTCIGRICSYEIEKAEGCEKYTEDIRDICYLRYQLCDKINDEKIKQYCYDELKRIRELTH